MELIILNSNMQEVDRYGNFDSLVWNERYQTPGDFQLRTYGIEEAVARFRQGELVSVSNSDFVMRVNNIDVDLDANNNEVVTVSGKTLEHIFNFRPALERIENTIALDANSPNGWEFGDRHGHVALQDPYSIIMQVIRRVDTQHYGREELKNLQLPFMYDFYVDRETSAVTSDSQSLVYHAIDRGATVGDVLDELLPLAQMGVATLRPNTNSAVARHHTEVVMPHTPDRPGLVVFYRPRHVQDRITFDHLYDDYASESSTIGIDYPNTVAQAHEDGVRTIISNGSGLGARMTFDETSEWDISDHDKNRAKRNLAEDMFDALQPSYSFALDTTGQFPYNHKKYQFGSTDPNHYFLGDSITLNLRSEKNVGAQVTEFIRTMDAEGYREYPTFTLLKTLGLLENGTISNYIRLAVDQPW